MINKINKLINKYDAQILAFLLTIIFMFLQLMVFTEMISQAFLIN